MSPVGFEPIISAGERPQTYALDRAVAGIGSVPLYVLEILINPLNVKLNPICHLLALLRAHLIYHVSSIRVNKFLTNSVAYIKPMLFVIHSICLTSC
jgi:hypothetical protein